MTPRKLQKIFFRGLDKLLEDLKQGSNGGKVEFIITRRDAPKGYVGKVKTLVKPIVKIVYQDGRTETLYDSPDVVWHD